MAEQTHRGVPLSTLSPKFLHTNSTSHTWPFSAIAELIDNAYDPDVSAKRFWIDKTVVKDEVCLSFMDNGNGLDHETMHKMLSFGYSDKIALNGLEPIGIYGNGFKSGSMRLGKDAIVFSKSKTVSCIGMLSQTYLEMIDAKQIIVPIISFKNRIANTFSVNEDQEASLRDILQYSLFKSQVELLAEIDAISSSTAKTGTRIIIWNLRRTSTGSTEFDFGTDRYDIRIPSEVYEELSDPSQPLNRATSYVPESVVSLRAYCSILYLKPRMQVMVRGQKVKSQLIAKSLAYIRKDYYKPMFLEKRIPIIFGYNTKSKDHYGIMMYHKNRLIKAYERVGCQLKANKKGVGVIGVIECNFLDPTHNKQSFIESDKYRKTINSLGVKLEEYWNEIRYRKTKEDPNSTVPVEDTMKRPDQNWVQCDTCLRWRKLPDGIDVSKLPDKWFCHMNPDPQFRSCTVEEEPEDSDDDQPSYRKTYKLQEREERKKQEQRFQQGQMDMRNQEEQLFDMNTITKETAAFKRHTNKLTRQLQQKSPSSPVGNSLQGATVKKESTLLGPSQAASNSSSNSSFPVITSVCSLSAASQRGKRGTVAIQQGPPKRPRMNGFQPSSSDTPPAGNTSPVSVHTDSSETDDSDDDLVILEKESTPKPQKAARNLPKVKQEKEDGESEITVLLECTDDAAVEEPSEETDPAAASCPPSGVASATTQTKAPEVKEEKENLNKPEGKDGAAGGKGSDPNLLKEKTIKQENGGDGGNQGKQAMSNGVAHMESDEAAGPSSSSHHQLSNIDEVQKQQDKLLELMHGTAQERDSLKEQVKNLRSQLQELQSRLKQLSQASVKKECSHQACQTEDERDYKCLFEKAKQKINDLIKDKEALLATRESKTTINAGQDEEKDIEEISHQVSCLVRELDQSNKERDELRLQLVNLEEEKSNLAAQCEELQRSLQQQRENVHAPAGSSTSDAFGSLIELRQNVGRLLISRVPALDLQQVNYECTVIDEILEQYLMGQTTND
ncbi:PREDICTED: MORC family CW-type zinc finger protein 3 [Cyprinodon variegatus]|uniref:MORC family CW-type zinc finger protein 3 n=1 Tax=Cyprinodon variegatus TaxID=28743 RepID=UPI000742C131|nr:PREDICTED: MORC family CW-type zinc finger protein 3 [Cyprinodon variegatus]